MFCSNCGSALPEKGAKFCPNCGTPLFVAEPLTPPVESVPEAPIEDAQIEEPIPAAEAAEVFESIPEEAEKAPEALPETVEDAVEVFETLPEEKEPEPVPETPAPAEEIPAAPALEAPAHEVPPRVEEPAPEPVYQPAPSAEPSKGLHFTAVISIVLTALSCLFFFIALLAVLVHMHPAIMILSSICLLCNTPFAFGFGLAAFIIGLKKKLPATWIIGLAAGILAVVSFFVGVITLITSIVYAVV